MAIKKQKIKRRWISIILFMLVSVVLFMNNFTELFSKFDLYFQIQWITWLFLIGITIHTIWLAVDNQI